MTCAIDSCLTWRCRTSGSGHGLPCVISSAPSPETHIVDDSIRREPPLLTADKWAEETMSALTLSRLRPEALQQIQESSFDILTDLDVLVPIYENL